MRRQVLQLLPQLARAGVAGRASVIGGSPWVRKFADDANLKKTALFSFHEEHGGPWAPAAGAGEEGHGTAIVRVKSPTCGHPYELAVRDKRMDQLYNANVRCVGHAWHGCG